MGIIDLVVKAVLGAGRTARIVNRKTKMALAVFRFFTEKVGVGFSWV